MAKLVSGAVAGGRLMIRTVRHDNPASLNIHPPGASCAPSRGGPSPRRFEPAYPTTSHPSTSAALTSNLQPPPRAGFDYAYIVDPAAAPVARHVWKPTRRRKIPSVQPRPPLRALLHFRLLPLINGRCVCALFGNVFANFRADI